ncbi:hypothetical protein Micbo1qcDRAFT_160262 [Microdochium bolleyi]|uniref:Uncharacterized protein n=1 Tax=Microdochium bolleyi TaxID=196109 RepID=A0A136J5N7_9PEZI|nr:hypothetical protein Micbo1qcDRAFT_160262 [Microdochium bolleyi]
MPLFTPASVTRGCITCFAGSSRRTVRGVFSPKIDQLAFRPYRLSQLKIVLDPNAPDLVYVQNVPPIRLLSHRRTLLRSAFTRYLQAKADQFVQQHEDKACCRGSDAMRSSTVRRGFGFPSDAYDSFSQYTQTRDDPGLVEDCRTTAGRYEIITVPNKVSILREIPWWQLPRGRFHSLRC